ncbi:MAG: apolipoprotein N-acyltransferase, partial [Acidimicrobiales bacterium]
AARTARTARTARSPRTALAGATALVVVAVSVGAGGLAPTTTRAGRSIRVALVQGGGPRGTRAVNTNPQLVFQRHLAASAALRSPLDLVVWPEGVLQSHSPFAKGQDAAAVASLARTTGATVVVGVVQDVPPSRYLNEAVAWSPEGRIIGSYLKNHLVPFGEYVPFRSVLRHVANLADVPYDAIPGHGPGILHTPAGPLGVMISYEVFYDGRARAAVRAGAQVLVVPTNTASYRSTQVPTDELAADRLRALETGRWLLQATPTGYTAVVGPTGAVLRRSALDQRAVIEATVPLERGQTLFVRYGDAPLLIAAVAALALAWWAAWSRRPRRRAPAGP